MLDEWQKESVRDALAQAADGNWAAFEFALIVPRQNGKGEVLACIELAFIYLFDARLVIHTAHEFKTSQEAFLRVKFIIEGTPELYALVKRRGSRVVGIRTANGEEGIELQSGARLRFLARSKGSGRGFTADLVILDEAYDLPEEVLAAIMATLTAAPNPLIIYTSSAALDSSAVLRRVMARGRQEDDRPKDKNLAYREYSADPKANFDDPEVQRGANPATESDRVTLALLAKLRAATPNDAKFGREHLGILDESAGTRVIDGERWASLADEDSMMWGGVPGHLRRGAVAVAIDVNFDGSLSSVALVGRQAIRKGGHWQAGPKLQGEIIKRGPGTGWVVDYVKGIIQRWGPVAVVLDPKGSPGKLIPRFEAESIDVTKISYSEHVQACGFFEELIMGPVDEHGRHDPDAPRLFVHLSDVYLDDAVEAGKKRTPGEAGEWLWHRRDTTDISPLVALTLAVFAFTRAEGTQPDRQRISTAMYSYS
ncbi:hypothetical protein J2Y69_003077 [Microbacterium resistens]|uniref:Terminase n=1 Tax=Microbacterium resistens TaxID=156977 RepID=A0ABU1SFS8_9MICO|nr:hypothetical protein [Microbacterium resistens]MDR6868461.1 hypothetical protein [Microbacterium resistens]